MLDGDIRVGPAGNFLQGTFNEPQIDQLNESQGFSLRGETVKSVAFSAHNQPLQAEFGIGGDMAAGGLWFFFAQAGVC